MLARSGVLWSNGAESGTRCHLHGPGKTCPGCAPVLPCLTAGSGRRVSSKAAGAALGWGWTPPGQRVPVMELAGRLLADVELSSDPDLLGWNDHTGDTEHASFLAYRCPGVTSHGFGLRPLRTVLSVFAAHGCRAFPQVYDTDKSTLTRPNGPERYAADCVRIYRGLGFRDITLLLGLSAGPEIVERWIKYCAAEGLPWHLYRAGRFTRAFAWVNTLLAGDTAEALP